MFESLESRRLMSVAANFADGSSATLLDNGRLDVRGGDSANQLFVNENNGTVVISNAVTTEVATFEGVSSLRILGNASDDMIFFVGNSIGAEIDGGSGNDNITIWDRGTVGSSVDGGAGADDVTVVDSPFATIAMGSGDDITRLMGGNSAINGGSGIDAIIDQSAGTATYTWVKVETFVVV